MIWFNISLLLGALKMHSETLPQYQGKGGHFDSK